MAMDLLQRILFTLGPPELAACICVAVPLYMLVNRGLDVWRRKRGPGSGPSSRRRNRPWLLAMTLTGHLALDS